MFHEYYPGLYFKSLIESDFLFDSKIFKKKFRIYNEIFFDLTVEVDAKFSMNTLSVNYTFGSVSISLSYFL